MHDNPPDRGPNRPQQAVDTVLLEHRLPDGTVHYDWLVACDARGDAPGDDDTRDVTTFRCAVRVDRLRPGESCLCERAEAHRRHYLRHEGPVPGGRGSVRRVAAGRATRRSIRPPPGARGPADIAMAALDVDPELVLDIVWFDATNLPATAMVCAIQPAPGATTTHVIARMVPHLRPDP